MVDGLHKHICKRTMKSLAIALTGMGRGSRGGQDGGVIYPMYM
jgi:hypothetical protein